jgi:hypothetical protein
MNPKVQLLKRLIKEEVNKTMLREQNDYVDVYNSIDWNRVETEILNTFGIKAKLQFKLVNRWEVQMTSTDITNQTGVVKYGIVSCKLGFGVTRLYDTSIDNSKFIFNGVISLNFLPTDRIKIGEIFITPDGNIRVIAANVNR